METVFLLWDVADQFPVLIDVFATREIAEAAMADRRKTAPSYPFGIEERAVRKDWYL